MPTVGLTGNMGMGKTTVLLLFAKLGAYTFNSDDYVHNVLKKPKIVKKIANTIGKNILVKGSKNISINKKHVADIIFNVPRKRKAIEKIIHPEVLKAMKLTKSKILRKEASATIIYEVPLLFEAGYEKNFDKIVVVYCNQNTAINRLTKKGFSKDAANKRIRAQMPISKKKKLADFLINNNDDIKKTEKQVKLIYNKLVHL